MKIQSFQKGKAIVQRIKNCEHFNFLGKIFMKSQFFSFVQNYGKDKEKLMGSMKIYHCKKCNCKNYSIVIFPNNVNYHGDVVTLVHKPFKGAWVEPPENVKDHAINWGLYNLSKPLLKDLDK